MARRFVKCVVRVSALCVGLAFGAVYAQEGPEQGPIPSVEQPAEAAEEAEIPSPVAEVAPVQEAPEKVKPAPKQEPVRRESRGGVITPNVGFRAGLGASAFAGHVAPLVPTKSNVGYDPELGLEGDAAAIRIWGGLSFSVGLSVAWDLTDVVDLGVPYEIVTELQYSLYTGYGSRSVYGGNYPAGLNDVPELYEAVAELQAVELPILVRLRYDMYYLELGPQFGVNAFSRLGIGSEAVKPRTNHFSFGPAVGFGVDLDGIITGIRWQMDVLEYAKHTKGRPWALQGVITVYPF